MKPVRTLLVSALFLLILLAAFVWLYPHMPARVPTHWNAQGRVNGYMSPLGAVATPMIVIAILAAITLLLPAISPRSYEITPFVSVFVLVMLAVQIFVLISALALLLNATGHAVRMPLICMLGTGVLWMVVGNYMGKLRKNFFIGIRTPWTLASDAAWERTHRMGGWLFMLAGAVVIAIALAGAPMLLMVGMMLCAALIPAIYSYALYRRLEARH
ncbi:MAG TPA: SdpI family protein [Dyella sp.]|uniref:SdpI family protein n=1 Tax=Dyella sp. TaxID=1869338 RepID=UPI002CB28D76|nr:SdpI family protein [Dyella sp.]HUB90085.1 SdpI family protein [Dyella sp.]